MTEASEAKNHSRLFEMLGILRKHDVLHGFTPEKLCAVLVDLGPTYIKIGQLMSLRPDFLPKEYCDELSNLRDSLNPIPFEEINSIITSELGKPLDELFSDIKKEPLGSASIAQVHSATLKTGERVVIKVQYRNILEKMQRDVKILKRAGKILQITAHIGRNVDFDSLVDELWNTILEELDFEKEADNLERFRKNQDSEPKVTSPRVFRDYSTKNVLTMEEISGTSFNELIKKKREDVDLRELSIRLAENYCKQAIDDRFFHADPHPGNIILSGDQIAWIDMGAMGEVSDVFSSALSEAILAIFEDDMYKMTDAILLCCEANENVDRTAMARQVSAMMRRYGIQNFEEMDTSKLFEDIIALLKKNDIKVPSELAVFARSVIIFEGTLSSLNAGVDLVQILKDYYKKKTIRDFSVKETVENTGRQLITNAKKLMNLPAEVENVMHLVEDGDLTVHVENSESEEMCKESAKRNFTLALSIIAAACFLTSGLFSSLSNASVVFGLPLPSFILLVAGSLLLLLVLIRIYKK